MSAGRQPERGPQEAQGRELDGARAGGDAAEADILGQIVAETASNLAQTYEEDPALKAAMIAVAREHAGQPLVVEGAGTALVTAVLRVKFAMLASRPALLATTARAVTTSLLGDPAARLRVENLWATLQEEAA